MKCGLTTSQPYVFTHRLTAQAILASAWASFRSLFASGVSTDAVFEDRFDLHIDRRSDVLEFVVDVDFIEAVSLDGEVVLG